MAKLRGMDAVIAKSEQSGKPMKRKKAALKRKGAPGVAIVIAMGKPPKGERKVQEEAPKKDAKSKLAALEARIAELEAQLAAMEDEDEEEDEDEMDDEDMA